MNLSMQIAGASLLTALAVSSAAYAQDKKVKMEELPPAVQQTVATQSRVATVRGFSTDTVGGQKLYEVAMTAGGHERNISMDEGGNIVEVEEEIPLDSLPAAVKEGLKKAAAPGTIAKVESITKKGKLVAYEATVKTGTKRSAIQVAADGKKLAHTE